MKTETQKAMEFLLSLDFTGAYIAACTALYRREAILGFTLDNEENALKRMPLNLTLWTEGEKDRFRPLINRLAKEMING